MEDSNETFLNMSYTYSEVMENSQDSEDNATTFQWNDSTQLRVDYFFHQPHFMLDLILGFVTFLVNGFSILAIIQRKRNMTTHIRLIVSLNAADMLVSISVLLYLFNKVFNPLVPIQRFTLDERMVPACMMVFIFAIHQMAAQISILNIMAMAVDHYMAVVKPLVYLTQSSKRQWLAIIIVMWFLSFCGGFSGFLTGINHYKKLWKLFNYCECSTFTDYYPEYVTWAMAVVAAFTITFIYTRISCELCRVNSQMSTIRQGYIKNQKAIQTTLVIIATFVIGWLPTCLFQVSMAVQVSQSKDESMANSIVNKHLTITRYLNHLYLVNALLDPIVYAFRLREVQLGYRRLFLRCSHFTSLSLCRRRNNRYSASFRNNKDITSMTSAAERGYLINIPLQDGRLPRQEMYRLIFPGRRVVKSSDHQQQTFSGSRHLKDQQILFHEMQNQKASRSNKVNLPSPVDQSPQKGCKRCSKLTRKYRSQDRLCLSSNEFTLESKTRPSSLGGHGCRDSDKQSQLSCSSLTAKEKGCTWCKCTSSV